MRSLFLHSLGVAIVVGIFFLLAPLPRAFASSNVSSSASGHWAWNDEIGWIDFNPGGTGAGNVNVTAANLEGYASSSAGPISFNCDATNPSGISKCGASNYSVTNDGMGDLGGWAWNDNIGWISFFWGNESAVPSSTLSFTCNISANPSHCGVWIDGTGAFNGWAWNDVVGWIDFNCGNSEKSMCGTSRFGVVTSWFATSTTGTLDSKTFDTGVANGAQLNSFMWKGKLNTLSNSAVAFEFAVSNSSSGPWNYSSPPCVALGSGVPYSLANYPSLSGRYFRYRIILTTNTTQTISPEVDDVIVNWSP